MLKAPLIVVMIAFASGAAWAVAPLVRLAVTAAAERMYLEAAFCAALIGLALLTCAGVLAGAYVEAARADEPREPNRDPIRR